MADPQIAPSSPVSPDDPLATAGFDAPASAAVDNKSTPPPSLTSDASPATLVQPAGSAGSLNETPALKFGAAPQQLLADYEVREAVGAGGFGVVYKAWDRKLNRLVALKLLRGSVLDGERIERFHREAQAMAQLDHPHIVPIFARGEQQGQPYLIMQFMAGGSLAERKDELRQDLRGCVAVVAKIARAVHYLHERKVLHRDLKPKNILFAEDGEPHLGDFGLAKLLDSDVELTHTGEMLGTLPYMAPEQLRGHEAEIGPAADIWALGIVLYEVLSGRRPFAGETRDTLREHILTQELPSLRLPSARPLEWILAKCLAKEPRDRYASGGELADELERWLSGQPLRTQPRSRLLRAVAPMRRHPRLALAAVVLLAAALVLAFVVYRRDPQRAVEAMQQDLAAGRATDLLHAEQTPRWQRWHLGTAALTTTQGTDAALALQTHHMCILELLPDPGIRSYRFSGEIRHDAATKLGDVGFVVNLRNEPASSDQTVTWFLAVTFTDLALQSTKGNSAPLKIHVVRAGKEDGAPMFQSSHRNLTGKAIFEPSKKSKGRGPWRHLEVTVTPAMISVLFDGKVAGKITNEGYRQKLSLWQPDIETLSAVPLDLNPSGGVGLILDAGEAAFRKLRIEPLTPEE